MWTHWQSELDLLAYTALTGCLTIMNAIHVMLIIDAIRLQNDCFRQHVRMNVRVDEKTTLQMLEAAAGDGPAI